MASASGAVAQDASPPVCPPAFLRWQEDCRGLAGKELRGLDRLRLRPLGSQATISFGAEARGRIEGFDNPDFGLSGPDYLSVAGRVLAHADLRTRAGPRAFVQLSAADEDGRESGPRPFDVSGVDLAQGFVDLTSRVGPADTTLRLGRQELSISGNRLVAVRDGATLRRAFDMAKLDEHVGGATASVFHGRPVVNGPDAFDDKADSGDRLSGASLDLPPFADGGRLNLFVFDRERRVGRYLGAVGRDERQTYGFRYERATGSWDARLQVAVQRGETAGRIVRAWSGVIELGRTLSGPGRARFALQLGAASGDDSPGEGAVEAFDPLYPNLGVFSSAPLYFPTNQVNVGLVAQRRFGPVAVTLDAVLLSRFSEEDAIYSSAGRPLVVPASGDKLSAVLVEAAATVPLGERSDLSVSFVQAEALDALHAAGGRDARFALLQLTTRF